MCVESSVRDLSQRDYEVIVVKDACGDFDAARHDASLAAMEFGFATLVTHSDVASLLTA
jgi:nicotinamidase-related amidase